MGVSFIISKKGKRYRSQSNSVEEHNNDERGQFFHGDGTPSTQPQNLNQKKKRYKCQSNSVEEHNNDGRDQLFYGDGFPSIQPQNLSKVRFRDGSEIASSTIIHCSKSSSLFNSTLEQLKEFDPSFLLNLYEDGFTFEEYTKEFCNVVPLSLIPYYDVHLLAKSVLTHIEYGYISTGIPLDDMNWKYVNGTIMCEVRDYRVFTDIPVINKVPLKMTFPSLVSDMEKISEQFSYQEGLEFLSRVLTFMHPFLNLEPTPVQNFGLEKKPLIKLIDWGAVHEKRRMEMSNNLNPPESFQSIIYLQTRRRFYLDTRNRRVSQIPTTPFNFPELVGAHLRGEGPDYSRPNFPGTNAGSGFNPFHAPDDCQSRATTSQRQT